MPKFTEQTGRAASIAARHFYLNGRKPAEYSDEFYTPAWLVKPLGDFDLDPCAGPVSAFASCNVRPPRDGLNMAWRGRVWLNPPYSNIYEWLDKFTAHGDGIALVNSRCETGWFQRLAAAADALFFPRGRINFARPDKPAGHPPCGSVLVAYGRMPLIPPAAGVKARPVIPPVTGTDGGAGPGTHLDVDLDGEAHRHGGHQGEDDRFDGVEPTIQV